MREARSDADGPVLERYSDVQHLRHQVAVGEPSPPHATAPGGIEPDPYVPDVRLEVDGVLDCSREARRRTGTDGNAEVLMEHPSELDAGLEQEGLASRELGRVDRARRHGRSPRIGHRSPDGERPNDIVERDADEQAVRPDLGRDR